MPRKVPFFTLSGSTAAREGTLTRHVVEPEDDVLRRVDDRAAVRGERMLFVLIMSTRASICASIESGTWTAIWSPSSRR